MMKVTLEQWRAQAAAAGKATLTQRRAQAAAAGKAEYHVITPEGNEVLFGFYVNETGARRAYNKQCAADWRMFAALVQSEEDGPGVW